MPKKTLTTRLDPDTKEEVEAYAEKYDIGQTEASRRLIRAGLDTQDGDEPDEVFGINQSARVFGGKLILQLLTVAFAAYLGAGAAV